MATQKIENRVRLFENEWLEKTSFVHPITPILIWGPTSIYFFYQGWMNQLLKPMSFWILAFAGFISWTLFEYILHRFAFHSYGTQPWQKRIHFIFHGNHHIAPNDPLRLMFPPVPAMLFAVVTYSLFHLVLGVGYIDPFFAAFLVGYLCYDYTHFYVHHAIPKNPIGRYLKNHHMQHHFLGVEAQYGLTSPLWDYVFGTIPTRKR